MLPRSLKQVLSWDNQLILLSALQAFSGHKAGHTISSRLGGREGGGGEQEGDGRTSCSSPPPQPLN